ncbi:MAG: beta-ketoacyl synthase chain length factor [Tannerellaceae bacterium]|jgi:hypothetical protein|nr:beta-ketoacyl synthase chain length factor [Tannerellaceae bacterium]
MNDVYILAAQHISSQTPLCEDWMDAPRLYDDAYVRAIDPDYKRYFAPNTARRLGRILKRALLTSQQVMQTSAVNLPDAVITATGGGCMENTEVFLNALTPEQGELLSPTCFMQSTHNTIGSLIAIETQCKGYNSTYSHKGISFECALLDAFLQLENGEADTVLLGAHDELTSNYFRLLCRTGYLGLSPGSFGGETALALMLSGTPCPQALCRVRGVEICFGMDPQAIRRTLEDFLQRIPCDSGEIDAVMLGVNNREANDRVYADWCPVLFPGQRFLRYKHLFGESYTAPALGCYAAAVCLHRQRIPAHLCSGDAPMGEPRHILLYNCFEHKNHSFILLSSCGK